MEEENSDKKEEKLEEERIDKFVLEDSDGNKTLVESLSP